MANPSTPSEPPATLVDSIATALSSTSGLTTHTIYTLVTTAYEDAPLFPSTPTTRRDRLVLITTAEPSDDSQVFTFGMAVSEFTVSEAAGNSPPRTLMYIEKIDSTGFGTRPPPTTSMSRAVVLGYVRYMAATCASPNLSVHVFARAQPQYLFPGSAQNPAKRVLSERALVKWWMKTLSAVDVARREENDDTHRLRGFWFVPGESELSMRDVAAVGAAPGGNVVWTWGWPWDASAAASSVVPRFPDDAKTKVLDYGGDDGGSEEEKKRTVEEFQELLQTTGECGFGRVSGFFTLPLRNALPDGFVPPKNEEGAVSKKELDNVQRLLMAQKFSSKEEALNGTSAIITLLKTLTPTAIRSVSIPQMTQERTPPSPAPASSISSIQNLVKPKSSPSQSTPPVLNDLQGLVKKKSAAAAAAPVIVNNIQGLIKKKPAPPVVNNVQGLLKRKATTAPAQGTGDGKLGSDAGKKVKANGAGV
ncbi:hypothetical protein HK104_005220 [Borealophlyctis nickersoniae]|nr:hypothetical protein HK104_005220 [Borealophlyctis nickersoniae]